MPTPQDIWDAADLPARRLAGVALNPSSSPDVLLRLLADGPPAVRMVLCRDRVLPDTVVEAVLRHPDTRTRSFFARNPHVDPAQRARLVDDPEWLVRAHLAEAPKVPGGGRPAPLPDDVVVHMMLTYEGDLLGGPLYEQMSPGLYRGLATHPVAGVRRWGVGFWSGLPAVTRTALLADTDEEVRKRARAHLRSEDPAWVERELPARACHARLHMLMHQALSRTVVDSVLTAPVAERERHVIAGNPTLPHDVVVLLSADPDPAVREAVAHRPDLRADERRTLATDPDPRVRLALSVHPALSEQERAAVDYAIPADNGVYWWPVSPLPRDPHEVRRDADSAHPLLRRSAARDRFLPPDLVERLAADDDPGVRALLAHIHPDAPSALLLRVFVEHDGADRARLITRPNFPTTGLSVFADHDDPEVRALAARDPRTAPATVERLTRDTDPAVRAALARHPALPRARLTELLADEELAHPAAANPALDPEVIERLVSTGGAWA
ncbi:hypothetical protein [uncultured Streptomyces sp.]|uniref:hypothetical protein n=1 Tax=uncultured Streptomyces sp. TaxID=174707 RepID=UPI00260C7DAE|nr:hypothetical protein [uncultured Streptomyces sp.]